MEGLGVDFDQLARGVRLWDCQAIFLHAFDVKLDGLVNEFCYFHASLANGDAARKVRYVGPETCRALLDNNQILHSLPHFFRPACLRMLFSVPGGTSTLSLPATVTVPGFDG